MKKILSILLALTLGVSVTACSAKDTDSQSASSTSSASSASESAPSSEAASETLSAPIDTAKMKEMYLGEGEYANLPVATMETSEGTIKIRLFPEQAPKAVENFIGLSKKGYYNGVTFHRVISDFMIQSGDPTATGAGGESIFGAPFEDEFSDLLHNFRGALSMANAGYATNGSQFFIVQKKQAFSSDAEEKAVLSKIYMNQEVNKATKTFRDALNSGKSQEELQKLEEDLNKDLIAKESAGVPEDFAAKMQPVIEQYKELGGTPFLDYKHTVFGYVIEGMDIVDKIAAVETGEGDKPVKDVVISKITIEEK
ncbi:peptidylprolyl isomerase [Oscillospiraceae bacterium PP1C4]